jgi:hypothetical protein
VIALGPQACNTGPDCRIHRAGHMYNRAYVIAAGCAIWAAFTAAFSVCTSIEQGMLIWAFNGMGLSWMIPNGQSLIADLYDNEHRGTAFGALLCTGAPRSSALYLHGTCTAIDMYHLTAHLGPPEPMPRSGIILPPHASPAAPLNRTTRISMPTTRPLLQALWAACWAACTRQTSQG